MTTPQKLMIVVLAILVWQFIRKIISLSNQFYSMFEQAEDFINKADRNSWTQGIKAMKMVEMTRLCVFGKRKKREFRQLEILFKSKFGWVGKD